MDNLQFQLEKAFEKVTATTCQKIIKKVRAIEDTFWREEAQIEPNQEKPK